MFFPRQQARPPPPVKPPPNRQNEQEEGPPLIFRNAAPIPAASAHMYNMTVTRQWLYGFRRVFRCALSRWEMGTDNRRTRTCLCTVWGREMDVRALKSTHGERSVYVFVPCREEKLKNNNDNDNEMETKITEVHEKGNRKQRDFFFPLLPYFLRLRSKKRPVHLSLCCATLKYCTHKCSSRRTASHNVFVCLWSALSCFRAATLANENKTSTNKES